MSGAPERTTEHSPDFAAALAASAREAGTPALVPGKYPRAHPIEVFGREDGSLDFAFVFHGQWQRLPLEAIEHAAVEIGCAIGVYVDPLNFASAVALLLAGLEKHGWQVAAPPPPH